MPSRSLTVEQVLALLAETPPRIAALTAGLTPAQLRTSPTHGGWSANDVLAHLLELPHFGGHLIIGHSVPVRRCSRVAHPPDVSPGLQGRSRATR
ncbi:MAG: hypothetical protein M3Q71_10560, partial [Chloroflexota bacterium]|nr:hypothetical protein [Chloroflexota bacterium]